MDWLKLFALLVAATAASVSADAPRKKIRIHIPQPKVKHIHHHKKVYILHHPVSSQYAPAYLPSVDAAAAEPTDNDVPLPDDTRLVPLRSPHPYEERRGGRLPLSSQPGSQLLPMYRARGYYGPSKFSDSADFDLVPPPEPSASGTSAIASDFSEPSTPAKIPVVPKKIKVIKVKKVPKKKRTVRNRKPKRIVAPEEIPKEDDHPVPSFHEQFYADLDIPGTVRKIRKPKRVEKIVDGNTEHIHTYSEEHIHQIVYDNANRPGSEPSQLTTGTSNVQGKNILSLDGQANGGVAGRFGINSNIFSDLGHLGPIEYAGYNPTDVTHDHVFHDHGEIPANLDISKDTLGNNPKITYTSQGQKITTTASPLKSSQRNFFNNNVLPSIPTTDFSYYENIYYPQGPLRKPLLDNSHSNNPKSNVQSPSSEGENINTGSSFKTNDISNSNGNQKFAQQPNTQKHSNYQSFNSNYDTVTITTPSTINNDNAIRHGVENSYSDFKVSSFNNYGSFKDVTDHFIDSPSDNYEYDHLGSPSYNNYPDASDAPQTWPRKRNKKKKSISTQNVRFGGQDHKTTVDHLSDISNLEKAIADALIGRPSEEYAITEKSPAHKYYSSMAIKAFSDGSLTIPDASNDNYEILEAPKSTAQTHPSSPKPRYTTINPDREYSDYSSTTLQPQRTRYSRKPTKRPRRKNYHKPEEEVINIEPRPKITVSSYRSTTREPEHDDQDSYTSYIQPSASASASASAPGPSAFTSYADLDYSVDPTPTAQSERRSPFDYQTARGKYRYGDRLSD